jgi:CRP/FNR family transcriptional regulator, anaerobic regulatory protein
LTRSIQLKPADSTNTPTSPQAISVDPIPCLSACAACGVCLAHELGLCTASMKNVASEMARNSDAAVCWSSLQTVPARHRISRPHERSELMSIICGGWAMSSVALPDGRRQILSFLLPGDVASFADLFGPVSNSLVEAITDVTCRIFRREEVKAVLFGRPDLIAKLARSLIEERRQADELAVDLGRRTAEERIARLILKLRERLVKRGLAHGSTFEFPLRQWQIADATGLTPVHVSRMLGEFQKASVIEIKERWLTILDLAELRRVADRCSINGYFSDHTTDLPKTNVA